MNTSPSRASSLFCALLLVLATGCQQEASSNATPTEAEAAAQSQIEDAQTDENAELSHEVKTVAAEQPILNEAKTIEPDFFAAPLESEIEADYGAPALILDTHSE